MIFGIILIVISINPLSLALDRQLELAKVSFDMLLAWGAGLIGIFLSDYMYNRGDKFSTSLLKINYSTKGLLYSWIVGGAIVTYWYIPTPFDLSVLNPFYHMLQIITFIIAGIFGGIGWDAMSKAWRSATLFSMFSMMAAVAEIFLEMSGYYSQNFYPAYPTSQLIQTSYALFAMAAVPSTYYMVKILKDLDLF